MLVGAQLTNGRTTVSATLSDSTSTELVSRAREAAQVLAEHAEETEQLGRPAPASMVALQEAGLLAMGVPREFGGTQAGLADQVRVAIELGRGCTSTAWVASLSVGVKSQFGNAMSTEARSALFARPDAVLCASGVGGGMAIREPGGVRVRGRFAMASGCEVARWAALVVGVVEGDEPVAGGLVLVPISELRIERTWRAAGLQGTGSHTLVADDVFVPEAFTVLSPVPAVPSLPPAALSLAGVLSHLAPLLGTADAAVTELRRVFGGDRTPSRTTYARLVDSPLARQRFARAERRVQTALRDSLRVADTVDEAGPGFAPEAAVRTEMRLDLAEAASACRAALDDLLDLRGAGAFLLDQRLQRYWRDIAVGTRYAGFNPYIAEEDYSNATLGVGGAISLL
ncbi:acyl-CoA dehydrogenase family protein [Streptomyces chartreusis]|uniref:acyl-CoA dehydrogenase family protein n=1 Tax=Streptomyces chartreusis TaxID=1969 RepID=UPI003698C963